MVLLKGSLEKYCDYLSRHSENAVAFCFENDQAFVPIKCVTYGNAHDPLSQAKQLFEALRKLDETGASIAYAHCPDTNGIGLAVYNRLLRSAAFDVIDLE
ncbi:hypothetical protein SDC9_124369 [bioreactor metagenome]|uniref:Threonylcarbamoyl-AMP synthase C-terminal domain-containing protein n=1 Tax=bioreactor metagenome TaxID=1076179 RepID=A0A645CK76_9ZZZZ